MATERRLGAVSRHLAPAPAVAAAAAAAAQGTSTVHHSALRAAAPSFDVALGTRQLFLDLAGVAAHNGCTRQMHTPTRHGNVVLPAQGEDSVQIRSAPAFVPAEQLYKLWLYEERGIGLALSADGINWERPTLQARQHAGSPQNNLVVGPCGEQVLYDPHDPDPSRRYKSLRLLGCSERVFSPTPQRWRLPLDEYIYGESPWCIEFSALHTEGIDGTRHGTGHPLEDGSRELSWCVGVTEHPDADPLHRWSAMGRFQCRQPVVSADGVFWRVLEDGDSLPSGDEANLSYDDESQEFLATLKMGEMGPYGRSIALATSADFSSWTQHGLIFHADDTDRAMAEAVIAARLSDPSLQKPGLIGPVGQRVDVYNMGLFRYEGVYVGMPALFYHTGDDTDNSDGFHHVQLCCSRDLQHWERLGERQPFIAPSPRGSGFTDQSQIMPPSAPVIDLETGNLNFYYFGGRVRGHGVEQDDPTQPNGGVMLATLRRDGFMGVSTGSDSRAGDLCTKRFTLRSPYLFVNCDCGGADGRLDVELLDANNNAVLGRASLESTDSIYEALPWARAELAAVEAHVGLDVQLRFVLHQAELFSYWFEPQAPAEY